MDVHHHGAIPECLTEGCSASEINGYEDKVRFYIELKQAIGNDSGDFLDYKAYEPDMRKLIDNYIVASDSVKIGDFDNLTLLDFVKNKGETLDDDDTPTSTKDGAAEAIENNIRRKVVEKVAMVVTSSTFTRDAKERARQYRMTLWDIHDLVRYGGHLL